MADACAALTFLAFDLAIHGYEVYFQAPHLLSTPEGTIVAAASQKDGRVRLVSVGGFDGGDAYTLKIPARQATLTGKPAQVRSLAADLRARMAERARQGALFDAGRSIVLTPCESSVINDG